MKLVYPSVISIVSDSPSEPEPTNRCGDSILYSIGGSSMEQTGDSTFNKQANTGFSIQIGKEYRKLIVENLELRLGVDLSFDYTQRTTPTILYMITEYRSAQLTHQE